MASFDRSKGSDVCPAVFPVPFPNPESPIPNPKSLITTITNSLLAVLLAPTCAACGAVLDTPLDGCVCGNCWAAVMPAGDFKLEDGSPIARVVSFGSYDGTLRDIIHALKYQGRRSIAGHLARVMRAHAADPLLHADWVVPVPLHWRREYSRGFNQAREIARHLGPPVLNALSRVRATAPQVELSADMRRMNVQGAFKVRGRFKRSACLEGRHVVIVDDVTTTGATLEACGLALSECGASEISAVTAARKA
jgi:ComF family protein